jgi:alpha-beta hydrolase superfamily lysophospholipase
MARPPILMIHGVGCTGAVWDTFAQTFRALGHDCETPTLAADKRLRVDPPASLLAVTLQDYIDEAKGWAQAIATAHGRRPVVVGHSMGGLIAQKLAEADLAAAAVLVTPASPPEVPARPTPAQAFTFANIIFAGKPQTKVHKIWRAGFRWGVLNRTPASRHASIYSEAVYDSGLVYAALSGPADNPLRSAARVDRARVKVPILTVGAAHDRATPVAGVRSVAAFYEGAGDYREYADHAHWIIDEPGAEQVATDIATWLAAKGRA